MKKGVRHITRDGYAQIVGGWLELDKYSPKQKRQIEAITRGLKETDELKVWSHRGGFTRYALSIKDKE